jgi:hypothetical protein
MGRRFWGGGRLEKAIYGGYLNIRARWQDGGKKPGCLVPLQHVLIVIRDRESMSEQGSIPNMSHSHTLLQSFFGGFDMWKWERWWHEEVSLKLTNKWTANSKQPQYE